ncbi:MAG TPA: alpha-galactosidase [Tepidisphaeraceae bacterium]|jgi:alpha-galactosidase|nr:alpha-galactosidase [Tepidisphaeraceae bacterium]
MNNDHLTIDLLPANDDTLWRCVARTGEHALAFAAPSLVIDGERVAMRPASLKPSVEPRTLRNGVVEHQWRGDVGHVGDGLSITITFRVAADSPVVRFRYTIESKRPRRLTNRTAGDVPTYAQFSLSAWPDVTEVRLSEFVDLVHSFAPNEVPVRQKEFDASLGIMGPILLAGDGHAHVLFAYEHGSTFPDAYLRFDLTADRTVTLNGVKGNCLNGQLLGPSDPFESVWFDVAIVAGHRDQIATQFREFVRLHQCENLETRKPYVFYNTWNFQERNFNWHKKPYLADMRQERILAEIEVAHRMGIEVFVIDTGWFAHTGDWQVNPDRFTDNLRTVKQRLDQHGMKLGLWFDSAAALDSAAYKEHRDCVTRQGDGEPKVHEIWETPASLRLCLVSRYWRRFADELIRLSREVGVTYFKWDAISQYDCDASGHNHGGPEHSVDERRDACAYQLPIYLSKIVERLTEACPGAIVDFDMTERGRCFGLSFLAVGKFFLVNNGPYFWDFNIPRANIADGNANLLFYPGRARPWFMRYPLAFDRWIPSNLFLTHYLPDDPAGSQDNCVASLVLGQNGIWGDLLAISPEGVKRIGDGVAAYKAVRDDVAAAPPVRNGTTGATPEWHEKLNPATGRGIVCAFANVPGTYVYVTEHPVAMGEPWCHDGVRVERLPDGRAKISATFVADQGAKMTVFGN